jgi:hypothetical protein
MASGIGRAPEEQKRLTKAGLLEATCFLAIGIVVPPSVAVKLD